VAAANTLDGAVEDIAYLGDMSVYNIRLDSGALVRVARTNRFRALEEPISWEDRVRLSWDGSALVVLAGG
jgi:putrescine transport system ATP-binding protein